eukprot:comp7036_c0_seq1/m.2776 comp7036_c0_seq1/g.2776  ORF comp7036_c0_seq1/g.2776 comp7036_c0_seq1/m.2776 type:complete len:190 (-) comp7036_c0_seq1:272-841(-)
MLCTLCGLLLLSLSSTCVITAKHGKAPLPSTLPTCSAAPFLPYTEWAKLLTARAQNLPDRVSQGLTPPQYTATMATRNDWKVTSLPIEHVAIPLPSNFLSFSSNEWEMVQKGLVPQDMDERWFIYCEGRTVYFHRSWSGFCVYELDVREQGGRWVAVQAMANRDKGQYTGTDEDGDLQTIKALCGLLTG